MLRPTHLGANSDETLAFGSEQEESLTTNENNLLQFEPVDEPVHVSIQEIRDQMRPLPYLDDAGSRLVGFFGWSHAYDIPLFEVHKLLATLPILPLESKRTAYCHSFV